MKQGKHESIRKAFRAAFPYTLPICAGFLFLGATYGVLMRTNGFAFWYPLLMSLTIFAGSVEFVAADMLMGTFQPLQAFLMTLMLNARHLFYGISMLDKYKGTGFKKPYLIFGLCDESFSINCTAKIPPDADRGWFYFFVTLLNHFYWVAGATLGGVFGSLVHFNTHGGSGQGDSHRVMARLEPKAQLLEGLAVYGWGGVRDLPSVERWLKHIGLIS